MVYAEFAFMCVGSLLINKIKKSKKRYIYILVCLATILFMGGTHGYEDDYRIYSLMYQGQYPVNKIEFLFSWAIKLGNGLGLTYEWFSFGFIAIGVCLLFYIAYKFVGYSSEFLIFYIMCLMFLNIVQIRNFMSMVFELIAFFYLIYGEKYRKILFCIFILVAMGFQLTAILYLPIVFFDKLKKRKYLYIFFLLILVGAFLVSFVPSILTTVLRSSLLSSIDNRISRYTESMVRIGYIVNWLMLLANLFIMKLCLKMDTEKKTSGLVSKTYETSVIMLLYFPIYRIHSEFYRIIMNYLPLICMSYVKIKNETILNKKDRTKIFWILRTSFIIYIIAVILIKLIYPHMEDVVLVTFTNRKFWF